MLRVRTDIILLYSIFENNEKMTQGSRCQMKEWDTSLSKVHFSSICSRQTLIQFEGKFFFYNIVSFRHKAIHSALPGS